MLLQTMGSILSSSTSNSGLPSPSLLNTNELLEMLMLPDSRGLTRNTDHLGALLRTNTWPSFFTGLGLNKKSLHSCPLLLLHSWWRLGELSLFVYATFKVIKKFFSFFCKESFMLFLTAIYSFPTPRRHGAWSVFSSLWKTLFDVLDLFGEAFTFFYYFFSLKKRKRKVC